MLKRTARQGFFTDNLYSAIIPVFLKICQDSLHYISVRSTSSVIARSLVILEIGVMIWNAASKFCLLHRFRVVSWEVTDKKTQNVSELIRFVRYQHFLLLGWISDLFAYLKANIIRLSDFLQLLSGLEFRKNNITGFIYMCDLAFRTYLIRLHFLAQCFEFPAEGGRLALFGFVFSRCRTVKFLILSLFQRTYIILPIL